MNKRQKLAIERHDLGFNCAQSVVAAFEEITGLPKETGLAAAGGLGAGLGSREEVCGALSGAVVVLGLLVPHIKENDPERKQFVYDAVAELRRRFAERFGYTRCCELLESKQSDEDWAIAESLGSTKVCPVFIMESVRILEEYLGELGISI